MKEKRYDNDAIVKLSSREHVRLRPLMYIESIENPLPLLVEIIDNSLDEVLSIRYKSKINITLDLDNFIYSVSDTGRGIPFQAKKNELPAIIAVATDLFVGAKFKKDHESSYTISAGLHGVGLTVVNYLSEFLIIESMRDKQKAKIIFNESIPGKLEVEPFDTSNRKGTVVTFKPDPQIFETVEIKEEDVHNYCKTILLESNVNSKVTIEITVIKNGVSNTYQVTSNITDLDEFKDAEHLIEFFTPSDNEHEELYIAFTYRPDREINTFGLVNLKPVHQGTHITFAKSLIIDAMMNIVEKSFKNSKLTRQDLQYGLRLFVSVKLIKVEFQGQSKNALKTPVSYMKDAFTKGIEEFLNSLSKPKNYNFLKKVVEYLDSYKNRSQNKNTFDILNTNNAKGSYSRGTVDVDNLYDCLKPGKEDTELYICEGSSAGGTLLKIRDRNLHGVLLLRGKTVNSLQESKDVSEILKNKEVTAILKSIGLDVKKGFDPSKVRYERILLISDPDPDGGHITLLVLSIFAKFIPDILKQGHVYYCNIPLYMFYDSKGKMIPAYTKEEAFKLMEKYSKFTRFKGLGEMDEKEFDYCVINKQTRKIEPFKCTDEDIEKLKKIMTDSEYKKDVLRNS